MNNKSVKRQRKVNVGRSKRYLNRVKRIFADLGFFIFRINWIKCFLYLHLALNQLSVLLTN